MNQTFERDYPIQTDTHKRILKKWFEETKTNFEAVKLAEKLTDIKALHFNVDQILNTAYFKPDCIYDCFFVIRNGEATVLANHTAKARKLPGGFMVCPKQGHQLEIQAKHFVIVSEHLKKLKGESYNGFIYHQGFTGDKTIAETYLKKYFNIRGK